MVYLFLFSFGICIGSFINCLVYRLNHHLSPLRGRSICPECKHRLAWHDNIPLLSFFLLKGRCRYCKSPISWYYPLVEFSTGVVFVLVYIFTSPFDFSYQHFSTLFFYLLISFILLVIFFSDLEYQTIPNQMIVFGLAVVFLKWLFDYFFIFQTSGFSYWLSFWPNVLSGILGFLFFLSLHFLTKGKGMGMGDVKLVFLLGLVLGLKGLLVALFLAFLTGALIGVILMIGKKKKAKDKIVFGPFLSLACFVALFFTEKIWDLYAKTALL